MITSDHNQNIHRPSSAPRSPSLHRRVRRSALQSGTSHPDGHNEVTAVNGHNADEMECTTQQTTSAAEKRKGYLTAWLAKHCGSQPDQPDVGVWQLTFFPCMESMRHSEGLRGFPMRHSRRLLNHTGYKLCWPRLTKKCHLTSSSLVTASLVLIAPSLSSSSCATVPRMCPA